MSLYAAKPWFVRRLAPVERRLLDRAVTPNALTVAAVIVSLGAGAALALGGILEEPLLWLLVPPLGLIRLALNALDGAIARKSRPDPFGPVANELGDRLSDVFLLAPLWFVVEPGVVLGAIVGVSLCSVTGLLGSVVSDARLQGGPMGKADRVMALMVASAIAAFTTSTVPLLAGTWAISVGALATACIRVTRLTRIAGAGHVR